MTGACTTNVVMVKVVIPACVIHSTVVLNLQFTMFLSGDMCTNGTVLFSSFVVSNDPSSVANVKGI